MPFPLYRYGVCGQQTCAPTLQRCTAAVQPARVLQSCIPKPKPIGDVRRRAGDSFASVLPCCTLCKPKAVRLMYSCPIEHISTRPGRTRPDLDVTIEPSFPALSCPRWLPQDGHDKKKKKKKEKEAIWTKANNCPTHPVWKQPC